MIPGSSWAGRGKWPVHHGHAPSCPMTLAHEMGQLRVPVLPTDAFPRDAYPVCLASRQIRGCGGSPAAVLGRRGGSKRRLRTVCRRSWGCAAARSCTRARPSLGAAMACASLARRSTLDQMRYEGRTLCAILCRQQDTRRIGIYAATAVMMMRAMAAAGRRENLKVVRPRRVARRKLPLAVPHVPGAV